jgi:hypothetical protein
MKSLKSKSKEKKIKDIIEDKRKVTEALKDKKIDFAINTKWPFIGQFLKFLECLGIIKELKTITGTHLRKMIATHIFVLLYILKIIVGIPKIRGSEMLLGDLGAMSLLGLNVDKLKNGLCERGDSNQYGKGYKKNNHASWMYLHY